MAETAAAFAPGKAADAGKDGVCHTLEDGIARTAVTTGGSAAMGFPLFVQASSDRAL